MNQSSTTRRLLAVVLCLALFLISSLWIAADTLFSVSDIWGMKRNRDMAVEVPNLVGTLFSDKNLPDTSLFITEVTYVYDSTVPPSVVLSQTPPGGAMRKIPREGTPCRLSLVVSLGEKMLRIPALEGMDVREAEAALGALGIAAERVYETTRSGGVARDTVISTEPSAGALIQSDHATVRLTIANPPAATSTVCPNLVGLTLSEAYDALSTAGLTLSEIQKIYTLDPWGIRHGDERTVILSQSCMAGAHLPYGFGVGVTLQVGHSS